MEHQHITPHLQITSNNPLSVLEKTIIDAQVTIEMWFREAFKKVPNLLTSSVDIRNAGFKLSPVDTNLFPAGFNNLNPDVYPLAIQALQFTMDNYYQSCKRVLIIPENHTRNSHYFSNLSILKNLFTKAGFDVQLGTLLPIDKPLIVEAGAEQLILYPLRREGNKISIDSFKPCIVVLNNDLSDGIPEILQNLDQTIAPNPLLGWKHRLKTDHFAFYNKVSAEFSALLDIDPWLINPLFDDCGAVNFMERTGEACLVEKARLLFDKIEQKYQQYGIKEQPFVVIKANQGTYGMAVMMIKAPEDIIHLNRKQRQSMTKSKGGQVVNHVIIQEGVHTIERAGSENTVAEPVLYMIGRAVIGGFYRMHTKKGPDENLNSPGMNFIPLAFDECCNNPDARLSEHASQNLFYVYSVIARLALLATCYEAQALTTSK